MNLDSTLRTVFTFQQQMEWQLEHGLLLYLRILTVTVIVDKFIYLSHSRLHSYSTVHPAELSCCKKKTAGNTDEFKQSAMII